MSDLATLFIRVDSTGVVTASKDLGQLTEASKKAETATKGTTSAMGKYITAAAATAAAMKLIQQSVSAFMDAEKATYKMAMAMKNQGEYTKQALADLKEYTAYLQKTTTVEDDLALSVMATMKTFGMSNAEMKRGMKVAADMAAATGKSIEDTAKAVSLAYTGQNRRLREYGVVIDSTTKKTDVFNVAMGELEKRYNGAAQAELLTYEGQWKQMKNTWGDIQEFLGLVFLKTLQTLMVTAGLVAVTFMSAGSKILQVLDLLFTPIKGLIMLVGLLAKALGQDNLAAGLDLAANSISNARQKILEAKDGVLAWTNANYQNLKSFDKMETAIGRMKQGKRVTPLGEEDDTGRGGSSRKAAKDNTEKLLDAKYKRERELAKANYDAEEQMRKDAEDGAKESIDRLMRLEQERLDSAMFLYSELSGYENEYRELVYKAIDDEAKKRNELYKDDVAWAKWAAQEKGKFEYQLFREKTDYLSQGFGDLSTAFSGISQMYAEGSAEAEKWKQASEAMIIVQKALAVVQAVGAIATQGLGDPYTAFVRIAAMAAAMGALLASIGQSINQPSGGASAKPLYGNTTVLGGEYGQASESLTNSMDMVGEALDNIFNVEDVKLTKIYNELRNLNSNITGLVSSFFRTGEVDFNNVTPARSETGFFEKNSYLFTGFPQISSAASDQNAILEKIRMVGLDFGSLLVEKLVGPFLNKIVGDLFGGGKELVWSLSGIKTGKTTVGKMAGGGSTGVMGYEEGVIRTGRPFWESDDYNPYYIAKKLPEESTRLFDRIYKNISDTLLAIGDVLAVSETQIKAYTFESLKIPLTGKSQEEINKTLQDYFSKISDQAVNALFGDILKKYQEAGEGLFETAARIIVDKMTVLNVLEMTTAKYGNDFEKRLSMFVGSARYASDWIIQLSEELITLAGGLENLTDMATAYYDSFFSDFEKMLDSQDRLRSVFKDMGMALPGTRDAYRAVVDGLDLSTESGKEYYITLLRLSEQADKYYASMEDLLQQRSDMEIELLDLQGKATEALARERENELKETNALLQPLQKMIYAQQDLNDLMDKASTLLSTWHDMESQLLELQSDKIGALAIQRAAELESLDESLRPLQELIYAQQDLNDLMEKSTNLLKTRHSMESKLLALQGDKTAILADQRANELESLDESLRPLQELIYAQEDLNDLMEKSTNLLKTRHSMESKLLELQGDKTAVLANQRANELESLDESLRPLQELIYAQEDLNDLMEKSASLIKTWHSMEAQLMELRANPEEALALKRADQLEELQAELRPLQELIFAQEDLNAAREKEKTAITNVAAAYGRAIADQEKIVSELKGYVDKLRSARESMQMEGLSFQMQEATAAKLSFAKVLEQARMGDFSGIGTIDNAMGKMVANANSPATFRTKQEYEANFYKTYNSIAELEALTNGQLTIEQQTLNTLKEQLKVLNQIAGNSTGGEMTVAEAEAAAAAASADVSAKQTILDAAQLQYEASRQAFVDMEAVVKAYGDENAPLTMSITEMTAALLESKQAVIDTTAEWTTQLANITAYAAADEQNRLNALAAKQAAEAKALADAKAAAEAQAAAAEAQAAAAQLQYEASRQAFVDMEAIVKAYGDENAPLTMSITEMTAALIGAKDSFVAASTEWTNLLAYLTAAGAAEEQKRLSDLAAKQAAEAKALADAKAAELAELEAKKARHTDAATTPKPLTGFTVLTKEQLAQIPAGLDMASGWSITPMYFADGGYFEGGYRVVGEQGPEIEYTGPSQIISNDKSKFLLNYKELLQEVNALRSDLNAANFQLVKNTNKNLKITERWDAMFERWDIDGIPEERTA
jgi:hypothetical protein